MGNPYLRYIAAQMAAIRILVRKYGARSIHTWFPSRTHGIKKQRKDTESEWARPGQSMRQNGANLIKKY